MSSPLPQGWKETVDPNTGLTYYYHTNGEVTWNRPAGQTQAPAEPQQWHQQQHAPQSQGNSWDQNNSWNNNAGGGNSWGGTKSSWNDNSSSGNAAWGNNANTNAAPGEKMSGKIKMWAEEKGYGFIIPDNGTDDVFIHKSVTPDGNSLPVGTTVDFEKTWTAAKSKYQAQNVVVTGAGEPPSQQGYGQADATPPASQKPLKAGWSEAVDPSSGNTYYYKGQETTWIRPEEEVDLDAIHRGTVKNFFDEKAFGFIVPDAGDSDVFVHKNGLVAPLESLQAGNRVQYTVQWNEKSKKFNAHNCQIDTSGEKPPTSAGQYASVPPSSHLFITGIPKGSDDSYLMNMFGIYGGIEQVKILPDTGKPDLAGLVKFNDVAEAQKAVNAANSGSDSNIPSTLKVSYKNETSGGGNKNDFQKSSWQSNNSWSDTNTWSADNRYSAY